MMRLLKSLSRFFSKQIESIHQDRVLRVYGILISLVLTLTSVHWLYTNTAIWLVQDAEPICWPMIENCRLLHLGNSVLWNTLFALLGFGSLVAAFLFSKPDLHFVKKAYWLLLGLNIIKHGLLLVDYRLRLNQHLMAFFVTLGFLLVPSKKATLKILVVLFYFWAGVLKWDPEWLSGAALYAKPWFFEGDGLAMACYYVAILETFFIWGLFSKNRTLQWATLAQLLLFHLFSFKVVGFFYPILCFLMLAIFPLSWQGSEKNRSAGPRHLSWSSVFFILVFLFFQILPKTFPGRTSVTGEGRLLSLHMFDSLTTCEASATIRMKNGYRIKQDLYSPLSTRIHCDPIVYLNRSRNICHRNRSNQTFVDIDMMLKTRRQSDPDFVTVMKIDDFCSRRISYSVFSSNEWILK